jgi:hypothetical protein
MYFVGQQREKETRGNDEFIKRKDCEGTGQYSTVENVNRESTEM